VLIRNSLGHKWTLAFIFCIMTTGGLCASAEDHGGGHEEKPAEGHGEAKAEASGEHKAAAENGSGIVAAPWVAIEGKIQEYAARIKSKQEGILELIEEKNHLPSSSPQVREVLRQMTTEHNELKGLVDEYQKNVNLLRYRFPERNTKTKRKYDRIEVRSLDEMEQAIGVDGKLNRNLKKMRSQYGSGQSSGETEPSSSEETKPHSPPPEKDKSIEDADSILIRK